MEELSFLIPHIWCTICHNRQAENVGIMQLSTEVLNSIFWNDAWTSLGRKRRVFQLVWIRIEFLFVCLHRITTDRNSQKPWRVPEIPFSNLPRLSLMRPKTVSNTKFPWPISVQVVLASVISSTSLITVFGNALVIYAYFTTRALQTYTNYYVLNLAILDLIGGLFPMPMYGTYWILGYWPLSVPLCDFYLWVNHTTLNATSYSVLIIAIDRFRSVVHPIKHFKQRNLKICNVLDINMLHHFICHLDTGHIRLAHIERQDVPATHLPTRIHPQLRVCRLCPAGTVLDSNYYYGCTLC